MGTITCQSLIDKAQIVLQDVSGERWDDNELLGWLNDGQRAIVLLKPTSYVVTAAVRLVAGTKQTLPADGVQLFDVVRNMGTNGTQPGRAVRLTDRDNLDTRVPNWHSMDPTDEVRHYMASATNPKTFYVYPPNTGNGWVEEAYGAVPPAVTLGGTISLDDIYATALIDYMLYRAFSKDTEFGDPVRANSYLNSHLTAIAGKARVEGGANPNNTAPAAQATPTS